jgi:hypothetical protein
MASSFGGERRVASSPAAGCSGDVRYRRGLRLAWLLGFSETRWKYYTEDRYMKIKEEQEETLRGSNNEGS